MEVTISVTADPGVRADKVELFLHETFHPDRVTMKFDGGVARHTVLAWGGFTVGAWIADRGIDSNSTSQPWRKRPQRSGNISDGCDLRWRIAVWAVHYCLEIASHTFDGPTYQPDRRTQRYGPRWVPSAGPC